MVPIWFGAMVTWPISYRHLARPWICRLLYQYFTCTKWEAIFKMAAEFNPFAPFASCRLRSKCQRWASRVISTKKTGSRGCVGKGFIFHKYSIRNSGTSSGDVVRKLRLQESPASPHNWPCVWLDQGLSNWKWLNEENSGVYWDLKYNANVFSARQ